VAKLCQPYNGEDLVWHKVDPAMGSVKVQGPQCSRPLSRPSAASFFKPHKPKDAAKVKEEDSAARQDGEDVKAAAGVDGALCSAALACEVALMICAALRSTSTSCRNMAPHLHAYAAYGGRGSLLDRHLFSPFQACPYVEGHMKHSIAHPCAGLPVNTDENAASVKKEEEHDAVVKMEHDTVKAEEALTPPTNGGHEEPAVSTDQPADSPTSTKRQAEDAPDHKPGDAGSTDGNGGPADKKPKPSPAKQSPLDRAAAAKGQRTMSSFFDKK